MFVGAFASRQQRARGYHKVASSLAAVGAFYGDEARVYGLNIFETYRCSTHADGGLSFWFAIPHIPF